MLKKSLENYLRTNGEMMLEMSSSSMRKPKVWLRLFRTIKVLRKNFKKIYKKIRILNFFKASKMLQISTNKTWVTRLETSNQVFRPLKTSNKKSPLQPLMTS